MSPPTSHHPARKPRNPDLSKPKITCATCDRSFSRKDNLKVHQRIHSGDMPFRCKYCRLHFRWAGTLHTHEASHARKGHIPGATPPVLRRRRMSQDIRPEPRPEPSATIVKNASETPKPQREGGGSRGGRADSSALWFPKWGGGVVLSTEDVTLEMLSEEEVTVDVLDD